MIITPTKKDTLHKVWLLRLFSSIVDNNKISQYLYFTGGTCAAMLGYLDRFSVDLDFDLKRDAPKKDLRKRLHSLFESLDMEIKDESKNALQFFLKYPSPKESRNTLKLEVLNNTVQSNQFKLQYFSEVDRHMRAQTIESMFANKLVAPIDRFEKHQSIAGRDIYDIHHFFMQGYNYYKPVIKERTQMEASKYFKKLINFIEENINQRIINEDLNTLLPLEKFKKIRGKLKQETILFLKNEN